MTVSRPEQEPDYKFGELSDEQQTTVLRRLLKVYAAHHYPERVPAVQAEIKKIARELRAAKEKT